MTALSVDDLVVRFGRTTALRGVTLRVERGEAVGLIGANGAGKTTLLSTVMGLVKPASGAVAVDGVSVLGGSPEKIARRRVAFVPEGRRIFGTMTVHENLVVGASTCTRAEQRERIERMLERFPVLRRYRDQTAGRLSGGEQQQLAIARALVSEPTLLLLDEPSLGLAPKMIDLVFEILEELRQEGVTILLVEQNARRTMRFADRTYVLTTGVVEMERTRADLASDAAREVEELYLGGRVRAKGTAA